MGWRTIIAGVVGAEGAFRGAEVVCDIVMGLEGVSESAARARGLDMVGTNDRLCYVSLNVKAPGGTVSNSCRILMSAEQLWQCYQSRSRRIRATATVMLGIPYLTQQWDMRRITMLASKLGEQIIRREGQ